MNKERERERDFFAEESELVGNRESELPREKKCEEQLFGWEILGKGEVGVLNF